MDTVRIDKWLWAARFFKTRALASDACDIGRIESNEKRAKPSRDVRIGDMLRITNEAGIFHVEVLLLSEVRGPAAVAQTLYRETEESKVLRQKAADERKAMLQLGAITEGRPSKKDRRAINKLRGRIHPF
jgi:ribosome-associated heat shock protein Hsp15